MAVFTLDNRLHMQHDFSRDTTALLAAVDRATTTVDEGRGGAAAGVES